MTTHASSTSSAVTASTEVNAPVERAFKVFTEDMDSWWNPEHHIIEAKLDRMITEPRTGGRIYDVGVDGSECQWGRVLAYEPPHRFVFSWDISLEWKIEPDPARTSEVEVTFAETDRGTTLVTLTHRHLDRHGDGWEGMAASVGSDGGWPAGLHRLAERLA